MSDVDVSKEACDKRVAEQEAHRQKWDRLHAKNLREQYLEYRIAGLLFLDIEINGDGLECDVDLQSLVNLLKNYAQLLDDYVHRNGIDTDLAEIEESQERREEIIEQYGKVEFVGNGYVFPTSLKVEGKPPSLK